MKFSEKVKTMSLTQKLLLLVGGLLVILLLWRVGQAIFKEANAKNNRQPAVAVILSPVENGLIRDVGRFSGTLIPKSQFVVAPKVSGKLKKLYVNIGDKVTRGQVVALIDDEEYQQQVAQAEADLKVARANFEEARSALELAKKDLERAVTLHQKGIYSDAQFDAVQAQYESQAARFKVAEAQIANREAALETARLRLSYTRIIATWETGSDIRYVGERYADEGALLSANTPIISIVELQPITAVIYATDKEYFRIKVGQEVSITSGVFPDQVFRGRVTRVAPLLKETTRQARIEIDIDNEDNLLKPGMFVNAQIEYDRRENARIIPYSAIVTRGNAQGVFIADIENRKAYFKPIKTGIIEGEKAEVLEPADLSGYVVTLGQHLLQDGMGIILPETGFQTGVQSDGEVSASRG
ncbi:MAG TPA: efflux RND transporter periplasmic adaptor subunit [Candidatus Saccharicenans sp.]|jgi:RND family efflux transporter MFP subunit|nr:efflux RND transporter periplasmic adaptor subunit [Candidatus Saccharicenans sp.]